MSNLQVNLILDYNRKTYKQTGSILDYGDTFDIKIYNVPTDTVASNLKLQILNKGTKVAECVTFTDETTHFLGELDLGTTELQTVIGGATSIKDKEFTLIVRDTSDEDSFVLSTIKIRSNPWSTTTPTPLPVDEYMSKSEFNTNGAVGVVDSSIIADTAIDMEYDNLSATTAPTVTDDADSDYRIGSKWVDITNDKIYFCLDNSIGAAIWQAVGSGSGGSVDETASITYALMYGN